MTANEILNDRPVNVVSFYDIINHNPGFPFKIYHLGREVFAIGHPNHKQSQTNQWEKEYKISEILRHESLTGLTIHYHEINCWQFDV